MLKVISRALRVSLLLSATGLSAQARVFVISDIDDTIKKANSSGRIFSEAYHFFKKKVYPQMRDIYTELEQTYEQRGEEVEFYYVSAAPDIIFDQDKWLAGNKFPDGESFLRNLRSGDTYTYKKRVIRSILKKANGYDSIYFFGDNSSKDAIVYKELVDEGNFINHFIYIRDVEAQATSWSLTLPVEKIEGINYFFSERELIEERGLFFISNQLRVNIETSYKERSLIPSYTLKTLRSRIEKLWKCRLDSMCRSEAHGEAEKLWDDYYSRY